MRALALVVLALAACTKPQPAAPPALKAATQTLLSTSAQALLPDADDAAALLDLGRGQVVFEHHAEVLRRHAMPPGSVMKLVTAYALFEAGQVDSPYVCRGEHVDRFGQRRTCWNHEGHGEVRLRTALALSCNVWFYAHASAVRPERFQEIAAELGIDGIPGQVPEEEVPDLLVGDHVGLRVTPLSLLRAVTVIATRGYRIEPSFSAPSPRVLVHLDPRAFDLLALGMEEATRSGTLEGALPVEVAAKTGTAPRPGTRGTRGFVVGYFPAQAPRYAFVVVKDHGRGAHDAAPFARVMAAALGAR
ncbi:MAG: penicillin-binding transpeptidase domain-containing protein [Myxococcota bacterium]